MPRSAADQMRQYRAKQEIHSERDKLLKRADRRIDLGKYLPGDDKDGIRAMLLTLVLSLICMVPYTVMIVLWFRVYRKSLPATMGTYFCWEIAALLMVLASTKRAFGKDRPWLWWLGMLVGQAASVGLIVGFFVYFRILVYYLRYEEMRTYTNVAASQGASEFDDGSIFLFTEDTRVDAQRAVGYRSRWTGEVYCIAPLVDATMKNGNDINFWVAGVNCCNSRSAIHCDDAEDFSVRTALTILDPSEIVRPFMRWAVQGSNYPHFHEAIGIQEATYLTKAATDVMFLRWSKDPIDLKNFYYQEAKSKCTIASIIYFVLVLVGNHFVAWRILPRHLLKPDSIIRLPS